MFVAIAATVGVEGGAEGGEVIGLATDIASTGAVML